MEKQLNPESAKLIAEFIENEKICVMLNFATIGKGSLFLPADSREASVLFIGLELANDLAEMQFLFGEIKEQINYGLLNFSATGGDPIDYHIQGFRGSDEDIYDGKPDPYKS